MFKAHVCNELLAALGPQCDRLRGHQSFAHCSGTTSCLLVTLWWSRGKTTKISGASQGEIEGPTCDHVMDTWGVAAHHFSAEKAPTKRHQLFTDHNRLESCLPNQGEAVEASRSSVINSFQGLSFLKDSMISMIFMGVVMLGFFV